MKAKGLDFVADLELKNSRPLEVGLELEKMRLTTNFGAELMKYDAPERE